MTPAVALLLIAVLLLALGRRHRFEQAGVHLVGAGFIALCLAIASFAMSAPAAEQPDPPPRTERYIAIQESLLLQIAEKVNEQAGMVRDLQQQNARAALMIRQQAGVIAGLCKLVPEPRETEGCR